MLITQESGCYALLRENRHKRAYHASAALVDAISPVGAGDVLLAGFIAALDVNREPEDALRNAVAAGTAATLEVGAGRFDPRQAARLASEVEVRTLDPVASG